MNLLKEVTSCKSMNELNGVMIKFSIFNFINEYKPNGGCVLEYTSDGILVETDVMNNIRKLVVDELITNNIGDEDLDTMVLTTISVCNKKFNTNLSDADVNAFAVNIINKANALFTATSYMDGTAMPVQKDVINEMMSNPEVAKEINELNTLAIRDVVRVYLEQVEHEVDETTTNVLINTACRLQAESDIASGPIQAALVACFVYFKRDLADPKNMELFTNLYNDILESLTSSLTEDMLYIDNDAVMN